MKKLVSILLSLGIIFCASSMTGCADLSDLKEIARDVQSAVMSDIDSDQDYDEDESFNQSSGQNYDEDESSDQTSNETQEESIKNSGEQISSLPSAADNVSGTYTMSDIKALSGTKNFADGTLEHIFDGTINKKGKATGYHYTMVSGSKGEIIDGTRSGTDENGVFTGKVIINGVKKNGFSSFYPESWSPQQVVDAINTAYNDALSDPDNPHGSLWIGHCGDLEIDMYFNNSKKITTAFPIYEGD